jgi:hypothetical protein
MSNMCCLEDVRTVKILYTGDHGFRRGELIWNLVRRTKCNNVSLIAYSAWTVVKYIYKVHQYNRGRCRGSSNSCVIHRNTEQ